MARGELKRELVVRLFRNHSARRPRHPRRRDVASAHGQLKAMVLVDERPPEVETRLIPGHHEGDLIAGAGNRSAVGALVERTTRHTFLRQPRPQGPGRLAPKALATCKVPKPVVGKTTSRPALHPVSGYAEPAAFETDPARAYPIFRDRKELATATDLGSILHATFREPRPTSPCD